MIESEKYRLIRRAVREFAKQEVAPLAESIEETGRIPKELYRKMAQNQYFGIDNVCSAFGIRLWKHKVGQK